MRILPPPPLRLRPSLTPLVLGFCAFVGIGSAAAAAHFGALHLLLPVGASLFVATTWLSFTRSNRRAAIDGEEVVLVRVDQQRFRIPGAGELELHEDQLEPLFLDADRTRVLAFRSPARPSRVVVLCADFRPLQLTPDEERATRERIESLRTLVS